MSALLPWIVLGVLLVFGIWGLYEQIRDGDEQRKRGDQ